MADTGAVAGSQLTDWISLGVLTSFVPRDAVDEATGAGARRSDATIPPQVVAYFVVALALFARTTTTRRSPAGSLPRSPISTWWGCGGDRPRAG
ncbi:MULTISPECIES: transposase domain-containing protein [unclassified Frankia]